MHREQRKDDQDRNAAARRQRIAEAQSGKARQQAEILGPLRRLSEVAGRVLRSDLEEHEGGSDEGSGEIQ